MTTDTTFRECCIGLTRTDGSFSGHQAWWAHALDLRGYVLACGRAQREGAS